MYFELNIGRIYFETKYQVYTILHKSWIIDRFLRPCSYYCLLLSKLSNVKTALRSDIHVLINLLDMTFVSKSIFD